MTHNISIICLDLWFLSSLLSSSFPSFLYKNLDDYRRGSRIQKGGGSYIQKGGGGFVQEFQERIQIVAGSWANQQAKKNCKTAVGGGGGPITPPKNPVSAHGLQNSNICEVD